jgi:hypothetical protein
MENILKCVSRYLPTYLSGQIPLAGMICVICVICMINVWGTAKHGFLIPHTRTVKRRE